MYFDCTFLDMYMKITTFGNIRQYKWSQLNAHVYLSMKNEHVPKYVKYYCCDEIIQITL